MKLKVVLPPKSESSNVYIMYNYMRAPDRARAENFRILLFIIPKIALKRTHLDEIGNCPCPKSLALNVYICTNTYERPVGRERKILEMLLCIIPKLP